MTTCSVVIATLRRPDPLDRALASLAACDPAPAEVIVVDGDGEGSARPVVERWAARGLGVRWHGSPPGLTRQRNRGLGEAVGDVVVFLDDDARVPPDVVTRLAAVYADGGVVGATGRIREPAGNRVGGKDSRLRLLLGGEQGTFTLFGYPRRLVDVDSARDVEVMQGAFMTARRRAADAVGFDEHLEGYALAEDEDFSCRLARLGRIRYEPDLVVDHDNAGFAGRDRRRFNRSLVVNRAYLFRKNFTQTPLARAQFWSLVALLALHRLANADWQGVTGLAAGAADVWRSGLPLNANGISPGTSRSRSMDEGAAPRPPRVAFVSSHAQLGGSERYLEEVLASVGDDWVALVACLQEGPFVDVLRAAGRRPEVVATPAGGLGLVRAAARLRRLLLDRRAEVVHANGVKAALLAVMATAGRRLPVVWVKHDFSRDGVLAALLTRRCRLVVGVSAAVVDPLGPHPHVRVVPTGVRVPPVDRTAARSALRSELGLADDASLLALAGRLHPVKGHLDLLEALPAIAAAVPGVTVLFVGGDDPAEADHARRVRARVAELGPLGLDGAVRLLGHRADAIALMAGVDAVVVPSGPEGFGLVAAEAMAVGTPVVAYADGAIPELMGDAGLLVAPGDTAALAAALVGLLGDAGQRRRRAEAGRARVADSFGPEAMVAWLRASYREAVSIRRPGSAIGSRRCGCPAAGRSALPWAGDNPPARLRHRLTPLWLPGRRPVSMTGRRRTTRTTVLAYHAVGDCPAADDPHRLWVPTASFERQLRFLARWRQVVPLDDVVTGAVPPGRPAVAITFDDAYRSVLETAAPALRRHAFPATVFTPTASIGDRNRWDDPTARPLLVMSQDELRAAEELGVVVESHGHAHLRLDTAGTAEARADLGASRERLAAVVGRPPRYLAWPFSDGSPAARAAAADLGFAAAFSIDRPGDGGFSRERVQVTPSDGLVLFALKTSGHWLRLRHSRPAVAGWSLVRRALVGRSGGRLG